MYITKTKFKQDIKTKVCFSSWIQLQLNGESKKGGKKKNNRTQKKEKQGIANYRNKLRKDLGDILNRLQNDIW